MGVCMYLYLFTSTAWKFICTVCYGKSSQNTVSDHHRLTSDTPFKCHFVCQLLVYWDLYALGATYKVSVHRTNMCYSIRVLVVMGATPGANCYSIRTIRGVTVNIYNPILHVSCHASDFRSVIFIRRGVYPSDLIIWLYKQLLENNLSQQNQARVELP